MKPRVRLLLIFAGLLLLTFFLDQWRRARIEASQDANILSAARRYNVDPALVKAVIWRESRFDPRARGRKHEIGLMQVMPDTTGRDWAAATHVANYAPFVLVDPAQNIDCGTWYLRRLLSRYTATDDPVPYALADYNAGRGNALKWMTGAAATNSVQFMRQISFPTTREYVRAILRRRSKYLAWAARQPGQGTQTVAAQFPARQFAAARAKNFLVRQIALLGDVSLASVNAIAHESASVSEIERDIVGQSARRTHQSLGR